MTSARSFVVYGVRLVSITYVVLGVAGFLPIDAINTMHHGSDAHYLFNLVAINWLHNIIHLLIGGFGVWAGDDLARCRLWGKIAGPVLLAVFAIGVVQGVVEGFPAEQMLLGLVPLNTPGHMLHLATGGLAVFLGFARDPERAR